jgi:hypothetical protein
MKRANFTRQSKDIETLDMRLCHATPLQSNVEFLCNHLAELRERCDPAVAA